MLTQTLNQPARNNRIFLLLIMALFIAPLLLAWILVGQWRPAATAQHGELLIPARPVTYFQALQPDGSELQQAYLQKRWTLLYIDAAGGCNERCRQGLYKIRQVRLALGKDMGRVQRLFLPAELPDSALQAWLGREHADMSIGVADAPSRDFFARAFPDGGAGGYIYVIDPLGNLLMRYEAETDPKDILEDLQRLLKLSRIG